MGNFLTGTNRGLGGLKVEQGSTEVFGVNHIVFTSGATLTNNGNGKVSIAISGGGSGSMLSISNLRAEFTTFHTGLKNKGISGNISQFKLGHIQSRNKFKPRANERIYSI